MQWAEELPQHDSKCITSLHAQITNLDQLNIDKSFVANSYETIA